MVILVIGLALFGLDSIATPWNGENTLEAQMAKLSRFLDTIQINGGNCINVLIYSDSDKVDSIDFFTGNAEMLQTLNDAGVVPFADVLVSLSEMIHQRGMKLWIQPCADSKRKLEQPVVKVLKPLFS